MKKYDWTQLIELFLAVDSGGVLDESRKNALTEIVSESLH